MFLEDYAEFVLFLLETVGDIHQQNCLGLKVAFLVLF